MKEIMKILLTNDDGINAPGIQALYQELQKIGEVTIIAPETEQSAVGHGITISNPLRVKEVSRDGAFYGYAVNGTPADCVKLGLTVILKETPDMVVSGINPGPNLGVDVIYSGTVSAATEGTIMGIPSIAVSLATRQNPDFRVAADFARDFSLKVKEKGLPSGMLFNVNVPPVPFDDIKGVKVTRQRKCRYEDTFETRKDPRGNIYYWLTGKVVSEDNGRETDSKAVMNNYISVTPLHCDLTSYPHLDWLKKWNLSLKS